MKPISATGMEGVAFAGTAATGNTTLAIETPDLNEYAQALGKRIELARRGESAGDFAAALGIHKNTLSRYEHGARLPDAMLLSRICEKKQLSPAWLLLGTGPMRVEDAAAAAEAGQPYQLTEPGEVYRSLPHDKSRELQQATTRAIRDAEQELGYEIPAIWASLMNSLVLLYGMHPEGITRVAELLKATLTPDKRHG